MFSQSHVQLRVTFAELQKDFRKFTTGKTICSLSEFEKNLRETRVFSHMSIQKDISLLSFFELGIESGILCQHNSKKT